MCAIKNYVVEKPAATPLTDPATRAPAAGVGALGPQSRARAATTTFTESTGRFDEEQSRTALSNTTVRRDNSAVRPPPLPLHKRRLRRRAQGAVALALAIAAVAAQGMWPLLSPLSGRSCALARLSASVGTCSAATWFDAKIIIAEQRRKGRATTTGLMKQECSKVTIGERTPKVARPFQTSSFRAQLTNLGRAHGNDAVAPALQAPSRRHSGSCCHTFGIHTLAGKFSSMGSTRKGSASERKYMA